MVPEEEPQITDNILLYFSNLHLIFQHGTDGGTEVFFRNGSCPEPLLSSTLSLANPAGFINREASFHARLTVA
jgi:hypothetical protein